MPGQSTKMVKCMDDKSRGGASGVGTGIDVFGGPVIDPTKNVLDLVKAESKYQDAMRDASEKYNNAIRNAENRRLEELAQAETRRVDGLEDQRTRYEERIANDLKVNVKTTSDQLAGQLIKETGALYNQIATLTTSFTNQITTLSNSLTNQIQAGNSGINTRLADLERFRWETGGRSAVADPALTATLSEMSRTLSDLKEQKNRNVGQEEQKVASHKGSSEIVSWIFAGVMAIVAVASYLLHH